MTTSRGCTVHEAAVAAAIRAGLDRVWRFSSRRWDESCATAAAPARSRPPPGAARSTRQYERAEAAAAERFGWEYRRCWKRRCWCMRAGQERKGHGPYRYGKRRRGRKVSSVYLGGV